MPLCVESPQYLAVNSRQKSIQSVDFICTQEAEAAAAKRPNEGLAEVTEDLQKLVKPNFEPLRCRQAREWVRACRCLVETLSTKNASFTANSLCGAAERFNGFNLLPLTGAVRYKAAGQSTERPFEAVCVRNLKTISSHSFINSHAACGFSKKRRTEKRVLVRYVPKRFNDHFGIANAVKDNKRTYARNKYAVFYFNFHVRNFGRGKLKSSGFC